MPNVIAGNWTLYGFIRPSVELGKTGYFLNKTYFILTLNMFWNGACVKLCFINTTWNHWVEKYPLVSKAAPTWAYILLMERSRLRLSISKKCSEKLITEHRNVGFSLTSQHMSVQYFCSISVSIREKISYSQDQRMINIVPLNLACTLP